MWKPKVAKRAKAMWTAGDSASIIAAALGVTRNAVLGKAFREDWPHPAKKRCLPSSKIWTLEAIKTAKRMWVAGDGAPAIARVLGVAHSTVFRKAQREKWPRPISIEAQRQVERLAQLKAARETKALLKAARESNLANGG
jgi:hypothetical protein